jgi:hypothetical protein
MPQHQTVVTLPNYPLSAIRYPLSASLNYGIALLTTLELALSAPSLA